MRDVAVGDPASPPVTTGVLAIPAKRFDRPVLGYLTREQIAAILAAPDRARWSGRRNAVLLVVADNTGARVAELTALRVRDVLLESQSAVQLLRDGTGRSVQDRRPRLPARFELGEPGPALEGWEGGLRRRSAALPSETNTGEPLRRERASARLILSIPARREVAGSAWSCQPGTSAPGRRAQSGSVHGWTSCH
jgi:integrase/recombinase XerD